MRKFSVNVYQVSITLSIQQTKTKGYWVHMVHFLPFCARVTNRSQKFHTESKLEFTKVVTTFMTSSLLSCTSNSFPTHKTPENGSTLKEKTLPPRVYSKRKEFAPKFFPFRVAPFQKQLWQELPPLKVYPLPLNCKQCEPGLDGL